MSNATTPLLPKKAKTVSPSVTGVLLA